jgi:hypothetical protein
MAPAEIQRESYRGRNRVLPFASRHCFSLAPYGQWFFGSNELISGGTREYVMSKMQPVCVQRQMSLKQGANPSDDQISKYCTCVSIQIADNTTYKRLASDSTAVWTENHIRVHQVTESAKLEQW